MRTPHMTSIRSTGPTSGATWRRSVPPLPLRDRPAPARRALVVRTAGHRQPARCRPEPGCCHSPTGPNSCGPLHDDHPGASQRGGARARHGSDSAHVRGQPRLGRERLRRCPHRPARPLERRANARGLRRPLRCCRLPLIWLSEAVDSGDLGGQFVSSIERVIRSANLSARGGGAGSPHGRLRSCRYQEIHEKG